MVIPLRRCLDAIEKDNVAASRPFDVMAGIREVKENLDVAAFLRVASEDLSYCSEVAKYSYSHSNGFDKFVLHADQQWKLRLHVWWDGNTAIDSDLHNHNWNFGSWILVGSLRTILFRVESHGADRRYHVEYHPSDSVGQSNYRFSSSKEVALTPVFSTIHPQDTTYYIDHREVHSGDPADGRLTATIVLQTSALVEKTDVFVEPRKSVRANETVKCVNFTADEVGRKFKCLLDRINKEI